MWGVKNGVQASQAAFHRGFCIFQASHGVSLGRLEKWVLARVHRAGTLVRLEETPLKKGRFCINHESEESTRMVGGETKRERITKDNQMLPKMTCNYL